MCIATGKPWYWLLKMKITSTYNFYNMHIMQCVSIHNMYTILNPGRSTRCEGLRIVCSEYIACSALLGIRLQYRMRKEWYGIKALQTLRRMSF